MEGRGGGVVEGRGGIRHGSGIDVTFLLLFFFSYSTVMCGDGANDCGVSEPVTIAYMRILLAMYEICVLHLLNTCVGAC